MIVTSRANRGNRPEVYTELATVYLPEMVRDYKRLVTSREALSALYSEQDKAEKKEGGRYWGLFWETIGAAILGAIVASLFTVWLTLRFIENRPEAPAAKTPSAVEKPEARASGGAPPGTAKPDR